MPRRPSHRLMLVAVVATGLAVAGCEEPRTTLTGPSGPDATDPWITLYPEELRLPATELWALDADDLWIGSHGGWLAHHDGERFTHHRLATDHSVVAIHGRAWNDVWAVTDDARLWRWDGRTWREAAPLPPDHHHSLDCLLVEPGGDVLVGGVVSGASTGMVARWNGRLWKRLLLGDGTGRVEALLRPHAEGPLLVLARTADRGTVPYALRDGRFEPLDWPGSVRRCVGTLAITTTGGWPPRESLLRIQPDGSCAVMCDDVDLNGPLIDSRWPLVLSDGRALAVIDCVRQPIGDIYELTSHVRAVMPERPGRTGSVIYATTWAGDLARFRWTQGSYLQREVLNPADGVILDGPLVGDGERLFARDALTDRLVVGDGERWRYDETGDVPLRDELRIHPDGSLLTRRRDLGTWGHRRPDGSWQWYPEAPGYLEGIFLDTASGDLYALDQEALFMVCRDGAWQPLDRLGTWSREFCAVAADQQYAIVMDRFDRTRILRYDGDRWHDITPGEISTIVHRAFAAPRSRRFFVPYWEPERGDMLAIHDGTSWTFRERDFYVQDLVEAPDGTIHGIESDREIHRMHAEGWKTEWTLEERPFPGHGVRSIWIDPGRGLYVLDHFGQLHLLPGIPHRGPR
ncbi:hypothetical protein GF314_12375 [bacterium]|nr:hypothetical protein [bacterium]